MANRTVVYAIPDAVKFHVQNIKLPAAVTWESLISSASDEVDAKLGDRYEIPVLLDTSDPAERPAAFTLQNITALIAAGRLLLSIAAPGSQGSENAYGAYLVKTAKDMLDDLASGKKDLPGAIEVGQSQDKVNIGPTTINGDAYSQVDAFYENFMSDGIVEGMYPPRGGNTWPA